MTTNLLQDAVSWLGVQLKNDVPVSVVYRRGNLKVALTATACNASYQSFSDEGVPIEFMSRDYFLTAADLKLGGQKIEPRDGDEITETVADQAAKFTVLPISGTQPSWSYMDPYHVLIVVHTKQTD